MTDEEDETAADFNSDLSENINYVSFKPAVLISSRTDACLDNLNSCINARNGKLFALPFVKPSHDGKREKYVPPMFKKFENTGQGPSTSRGNMKSGGHTYRFEQDNHRFTGPTNATNFHNSFHVKRQTCYNCGIPGHIARNCKHLPYVPYYNENRNHSERFHHSARPNHFQTSQNDNFQKVFNNNWNNLKKQFSKEKQEKVFEKIKKVNIEKPKTEKVKKLKSVWKPKEAHVSSASSSCSSQSNSSKTNLDTDLILQEVSYIDSNGTPRSTMAWVPKSN